MGHGQSIALEAPVNPKAGSKSYYVLPTKDHIPSNGEVMEIGTASQTAKTPTPTANVCKTTSLATPPTHTKLVSTSSGLQITFDQRATPTLPTTMHTELLHWILHPSGWLKPLRALTPPSFFHFYQFLMKERVRAQFSTFNASLKAMQRKIANVGGTMSREVAPVVDAMPSPPSICWLCHKCKRLSHM